MSIANRVLICLLLLTHLSACATRQPIPIVSEAQRERMGVVGVGSIARAPKGELDVGTRGRGAGAAKGATEGAASGAAALFSGGRCSGSMCVAAFIVLLPVFVVAGASVGAVSGAVQAVPVDSARQIEAQLNLALAEGGPQEALRYEVVKAAARSGIPGVAEITAGTATMIGEDVDYRKLSNLAVDTVLEVGLVRIGLTGRGGDDPQLALGVHAVARLVDVKTNAELYRNYAFIHVTPRRKFSEWSANEALLLKREIDRAYESLGTSIVDEVFLVFRTN